MVPCQCQSRMDCIFHLLNSLASAANAVKAWYIEVQLSKYMGLPKELVGAPQNLKWTEEVEGGMGGPGRGWSSIKEHFLAFWLFNTHLFMAIGSLEQQSLVSCLSAEQCLHLINLVGCKGCCRIIAEVAVDWGWGVRGHFYQPMSQMEYVHLNTPNTFHFSNSPYIPPFHQ